MTPKRKGHQVPARTYDRRPLRKASYRLVSQTPGTETQQAKYLIENIESGHQRTVYRREFRQLQRELRIVKAQIGRAGW